jgi:DNA-binding MarR family transcriptional regulator
MPKKQIPREEKSYSKLTKDEVELIFNTYHDREDEENIWTQYELADYFNVHQSTISRIVNKKRWEHLWEENRQLDH